MKIYIASDHAGFELKKALLLENNEKFIDLGPSEFDKDDDYPDYAGKLVSKLNKNDFGVLICGSGQGMAMAANKLGSRAALCRNEEDAIDSREHNDARIACLGAKYTTKELAEKIINCFVEAKFSGEERHVRRIGKI